MEEGEIRLELLKLEVGKGNGDGEVVNGVAFQMIEVMTQMTLTTIPALQNKMRMEIYNFLSCNKNLVFVIWLCCSLFP